MVSGVPPGQQAVCPQVDKMAAIAACPRPKTKKEVRRFLGLAGYYQWFIPVLFSPVDRAVPGGA